MGGYTKTFGGVEADWRSAVCKKLQLQLTNLTVGGWEGGAIGDRRTRRPPLVRHTEFVAYPSPLDRIPLRTNYPRMLGYLFLLQSVLILTSGFRIAHKFHLTQKFSIMSMNGDDRFPSIDAVLKANKERERVFNQLSFPTSFTIKVIGSKDATFMSDILQIVENVTSLPSEDMNVRTKDTGKFLSITISPVFNTAHQIYAVYEAVCKDARVKYVL